MIVMFVELAGAEHDDFTSRVHTPFFTAMNKAGMSDVFAGIAISTLKLPGTETWAKAHEKGNQRLLRLAAPAAAPTDCCSAEVVNRAPFRPIREQTACKRVIFRLARSACSVPDVR
jgi:hypothetical protein